MQAALVHPTRPERWRTRRAACGGDIENRSAACMCLQFKGCGIVSYHLLRRRAVGSRHVAFRVRRVGCQRPGRRRTAARPRLHGQVWQVNRASCAPPCPGSSQSVHDLPNQPVRRRAASPAWPAARIQEGQPRKSVPLQSKHSQAQEGVSGPGCVPPQRSDRPGTADSVCGPQLSNDTAKRLSPRPPAPPRCRAPAGARQALLRSRRHARGVLAAPTLRLMRRGSSTSPAAIMIHLEGRLSVSDVHQAAGNRQTGPRDCRQEGDRPGLQRPGPR